MLQVGPWSRLPLTMRWLDDQFGAQYSKNVSPPFHMPITFGKVTSKKPKDTTKKKGSKNKKVDEKEEEKEMKLSLCAICKSIVNDEDLITCLQTNCTLISHLVCLAESFTKDDMILPVEGCCPICSTSLLWGDLIRKKIGCNMHLNDEEEDDINSDFSDD